VSFTKRLGQRIVGQGRLFRDDTCDLMMPSGYRPDGCTFPIGLGENHIQRDRGSAELPESIHQTADDVAAPGPLSNVGQTLLVHIDNDDAPTWRPGRDRPRECVEHHVVEPDEEGRSERNKNGYEERWNRAAAPYQASR
jgi:hypothetical protein